VAFALAKVGVVIIAILFATSFSAFAQPPTPITFISTGGVLSSTSTDGETISTVCGKTAGSVALTIEGRVTDMNMAFMNCASLKEVTIEDDVTDMFMVFTNCLSLEKVTIKGNVIGITSAFPNCVLLKEITFTQTTPPDMGAGATSTFRNAGRDVAEVVVNLPFMLKAKVSEWRDALISADLDPNKLTINIAEAPPKQKTKIGRLNIKQGKVEIKPKK